MNSQYYKVTAYVGTPHRNAVEVTIPLVGPAGPQGPAGEAGAGAVESVNGQTGVVVLAAADVGAASTSHTHGNLSNAGAIGTTANLPVKTGTSGVLEAGAFGTAAGQFAEGNHTHAASAITSGVLNFNRVMQQVSIESVGTELAPDVLDLTSNIVGGNLHALAIILSAQADAYTEVVLPDLGAGALGVVTVRPNYFEDPSANFLKVTNGTTNIWPAPPSTFIEMDDNEEVTFRWNQGKWDMDIRPNPAATAVPVQIFKPNSSGTLGLSEPSDSTFRIVGSSDATKKVAFEVDGLTTATVRTLTVPDASGRIQIEGQAIGNTTPAAISGTTGTFTTLAANNGTLTASAPVLDLGQTWNSSGTTFTGLRVNITNTASAAASNIAVFQVGGVTRAAITRAGNIQSDQQFITTGSALQLVQGATVYQVYLGTFGPTNNAHGFALGANQDIEIMRDAADALAQRRSTNAQTFNIYNTFTSATNHERGFLRWNSNVFEIGTEEGSGGGSRRDLRLKTGVGTHVDIMAGGGTLAWRFNSVGELVPNATNTRDFGNVSTRVRTGFFESLFVGTTFEIYNARTSATNFERLNIRKASNEFIIDAQVGADGGTLRGIKLGSATSSLLGFYGATPVDRPATVADPAGGGTIDTEARTAINDIIDRLQELGLIA
jgi:hypothetical protein